MFDITTFPPSRTRPLPGSFVTGSGLASAHPEKRRAAFGSSHAPAERPAGGLSASAAALEKRTKGSGMALLGLHDGDNGPDLLGAGSHEAVQTRPILSRSTPR